MTRQSCAFLRQRQWHPQGLEGPPSGAACCLGWLGRAGGCRAVLLTHHWHPRLGGRVCPGTMSPQLKGNYF